MVAATVLNSKVAWRAKMANPNLFAAPGGMAELRNQVICLSQLLIRLNDLFT
jgi:hypothetical protein